MLFILSGALDIREARTAVEMSVMAWVKLSYQPSITKTDVVVPRIVLLGVILFSDISEVILSPHSA